MLFGLFGFCCGDPVVVSGDCAFIFTAKIVGFHPETLMCCEKNMLLYKQAHVFDTCCICYTCALLPWGCLTILVAWWRWSRHTKRWWCVESTFHRERPDNHPGEGKLDRRWMRWAPGVKSSQSSQSKPERNVPKNFARAVIIFEKKNWTVKWSWTSMVACIDLCSFFKILSIVYYFWRGLL